MTYYTAVIYKNGLSVNARTFTDMASLNTWVNLRDGERLEIESETF